MAKVNRGKQFEEVIEKAFYTVPNTTITRLHDQTTGYKGSSNICDYIVYKYPHQYFVECKSCYGNTLSIHSNDPKKRYGAISNTQWEGLLEVSQTKGVVAGVIVWFIDHDDTLFIPISTLVEMRNSGCKSVNINKLPADLDWLRFKAKKKRVFFEYDMKELFFYGETLNYGKHL